MSTRKAILSHLKSIEKLTNPNKSTLKPKKSLSSKAKPKNKKAKKSIRGQNQEYDNNDDGLEMYFTLFHAMHSFRQIVQRQTLHSYFIRWCHSYERKISNRKHANNYYDAQIKSFVDLFPSTYQEPSNVQLSPHKSVRRAVSIPPSEKISDAVKRVSKAHRQSILEKESQKVSASKIKKAREYPNLNDEDELMKYATDLISKRDNSQKEQKQSQNAIQFSINLKNQNKEKHDFYQQRKRNELAVSPAFELHTKTIRKEKSPSNVSSSKSSLYIQPINIVDITPTQNKIDPCYTPESQQRSQNGLSNSKSDLTASMNVKKLKSNIPNPRLFNPNENSQKQTKPYDNSKYQIVSNERASQSIKPQMFNRQSNNNSNSNTNSFDFNSSFKTNSPNDKPIKTNPLNEQSIKLNSPNEQSTKVNSPHEKSIKLNPPIEQSNKVNSPIEKSNKVNSFNLNFKHSNVQTEFNQNYKDLNSTEKIRKSINDNNSFERNTINQNDFDNQKPKQNDLMNIEDEDDIDFDLSDLKLPQSLLNKKQQKPSPLNMKTKLSDDSVDSNDLDFDLSAFRQKLKTKPNQPNKQTKTGLDNSLKQKVVNLKKEENSDDSDEKMFKDDQSDDSNDEYFQKILTKAKKGELNNDYFPSTKTDGGNQKSSSKSNEEIDYQQILKSNKKAATSEKYLPLTVENDDFNQKQHKNDQGIKISYKLNDSNNHQSIKKENSDKYLQSNDDNTDDDIKRPIGLNKNDDFSDVNLSNDSNEFIQNILKQNKKEPNSKFDPMIDNQPKTDEIEEEESDDSNNSNEFIQKILKQAQEEESDDSTNSEFIGNILKKSKTKDNSNELNSNQINQKVLKQSDDDDYIQKILKQTKTKDNSNEFSNQKDRKQLTNDEFIQSGNRIKQTNSNQVNSDEKFLKNSQNDENDENSDEVDDDYIQNLLKHTQDDENSDDSNNSNDIIQNILKQSKSKSNSNELNSDQRVSKEASNDDDYIQKILKQVQNDSNLSDDKIKQTTTKDNSNDLKYQKLHKQSQNYSDDNSDEFVQNILRQTKSNELKNQKVLTPSQNAEIDHDITPKENSDEDDSENDEEFKLKIQNLLNSSQTNKQENEAKVAYTNTDESYSFANTSNDANKLLNQSADKSRKPQVTFSFDTNNQQKSNNEENSKTEISLLDKVLNKSDDDLNHMGNDGVDESKKEINEIVMSSDDDDSESYINKLKALFPNVDFDSE